MIYGTQEFAQLLKAVIKEGYRHPKYEETVQHAKEMGVHIYGDDPAHLINRLRPREEEEVKDYRVESFEPITKASAGKCIDIVTKMFNPTIYSIRWKDPDSEAEELKEYTMEYYPEFNSIVNYNKTLALRKALADPNALQCVKPGKLPESDLERLGEPKIVIYGSKNLWYYDEDHYLAFIRQEKVDTQEYFYFDYYDGSEFLHFKCWYDASDKSINTIELQEYFHNFGEIPCWFLKGIPKACENGEYFYESYFSPALAHWNKAIMHESDLDGAFVGHMHPQKYIFTEECHYQFKHEGTMVSCRGGKLKYAGKDGVQVIQDCDACNGTGRTTVKGPHHEYLFDTKKLQEGEINQLPVGYIDVPTEATELLVERAELMHTRALWALNMDIEDRVGENQSGAAKVIDRSAQQDTIFNIACTVFDEWLPNQFYFIDKYKFGTQRKSLGKKDDGNLPEINKPAVIDILTQSDLVNNFKVAAESKLDKNYLKQKQIEIVNRDPSMNPDQKAYLIAVIDLNPLAFFSQDEIDLGTNKGTIRQVDWAISNNINAFVDKAIAEKKNFFDLDKQDRIAILEQYGNELIEGEKPRIEESMMQKFEIENQNAA
jgi:hypothetical protein